MQLPDLTHIESVWPLVVTVFTMSVLGSLHCAGMCGGLMFFALGSDQSDDEDGTTRKHSKVKLQCAYHGGRLVTYTILGIIAGFIGQAIDFGGGYLGIQRGAMMFAGIMMVGFGVITIARMQGIRIKHLGVPASLRRLIERAQRAAFGLDAFKRALMIGLLTTLLPCGWLYAFAFLAAGTASPIWGGVTMAAFWMGTLPVMVSLGAGIQLVSSKINLRLPIITSLAVIVVGVMTAMGGMHVTSAISRETLGIGDDPMAVPMAGGVGCPLCEQAEQDAQQDAGQAAKQAVDEPKAPDGDGLTNDKSTPDPVEEPAGTDDD
ncbi:MAG: sulfite exporter TauE/SafE family protein [Phycisphaerales bacterium]